MMVDMSRYAKGGWIPSRTGRSEDDSVLVPVALNRGCAVVPASVLAKYGRDYLEQINGGNTDVYSANEVIAEYDDER